jgi:hypothetical protein
MNALLLLHTPILPLRHAAGVDMGTDPMAVEWLRLGVRAALDGNREDARYYFVQAVRTDLNFARAWLYLGGVADDPALTLSCVQKVLQLDPGEPQARVGLAWARDRLGLPPQLPAWSLIPAPVPAAPRDQPASDRAPYAQVDGESWGVGNPAPPRTLLWGGLPAPTTATPPSLTAPATPPLAGEPRPPSALAQAVEEAENALFPQLSVPALLPVVPEMPAPEPLPMPALPPLPPPRESSAPSALLAMPLLNDRPPMAVPALPAWAGPVLPAGPAAPRNGSAETVTAPAAVAAPPRESANWNTPVTQTATDDVDPFNRSDWLLRRGVSAAADGNRMRARYYFLKAIAADAGNTRAWLYLGGVAGDPSLTLACMERVLHTEPWNREARVGAEWALQQLGPNSPGTRWWK